MYHQADVFITATDALKVGIIREIGNFAPRPVPNYSIAKPLLLRPSRHAVVPSLA